MLPKDHSVDIETAHYVLNLESEALIALKNTLSESFIRLIDMLMRVEGRVVVTGMGKSGHIGRKIAATLSSTGTPALFVHPGEAGHGDLGMITSEDAVIALSNSGESEELSSLISYTRRFSIPFVAVTRDKHSTLARAADYCLLLPNVPEACWIGLAPTTSTTMLLALGDALAITLLRRKGFTAEDFSTLHPKGKLGRILLRVETIMHTSDALPVVREEEPMSEVIVVMSEKGFGCAGVVNEQGLLTGMITDGDLRRHMGEKFLSAKALSVMSPDPKVIPLHALAAEALKRMNEYKITSLFVVSDTQSRIPIGLVHVHDCLRFGVL